MSKQIKIDFILEINDKPMTPNILTSKIIEFFDRQGWEYKGIIENLEFYEDEQNTVEVNYGTK